MIQPGQVPHEKWVFSEAWSMLATYYDADMSTAAWDEVIERVDRLHKSAPDDVKDLLRNILFATVTHLDRVHRRRELSQE